MSGGGSTNTVQNADPWSGAQPYLRDIMSRGAQWANNPAGFYPGATYLGPTQGQLAGWDTQLNYADQVYGGAQAPRFGEATGALSNVLTGNTAMGSLAGGYSGAAGSALGRMLSGTPDYSAVQGAVNAANAPILRQFEQDILPGLNQRATFLGNPTGGIKTLNRVLPDLGERMALNAQGAYLDEYNRAQGAQQAGLGMYGQIAGAQTDAALRGVSMFPGLVQAGSVPGQLSSQFADWGAGFQQQALQDQMDRWNYYQNLPLTSAQQYSGLVTGMGGMGGTTTTTGPGGSRMAGALGGATTGAMLGSMVGGMGGGAAAGAGTGATFGPWGALIGAGLGYLMSG